LWATVAAVRSQLDTEQPFKQPVQEVRIEVDKVGVAQQVSKLTGTDYFKKLRGKANDLCDMIEDAHK
jgi:hypothetical protein